MKKLLRLLVIVFLGIATFVFIKQKNNTTPTDDTVGIANPASVYCIENGGTLEIVTGPNGGQIGMCHFPDGSSCEERAFYRGECAKNDILIVNDFYSCVQAGNPIMESYPRQCAHNGTTYTEVIKKDITTPTEEEEAVFCTMDAKECPDGSYVGRIPPNCEFAPCPGN